MYDDFRELMYVTCQPNRTTRQKKPRSFQGGDSAIKNFIFFVYTVWNSYHPTDKIKRPQDQRIKIDRNQINVYFLSL